MYQIKLFVIYPQIPVNIRPALKTRDWMPANALRCLPVQIANQYGYEILCNEDMFIYWNGGPNYEDITSESKYVVSNSGNGFFSIHTNLVVRTPPGVNLWVQGPINGIQEAKPITAIIESDWNISQLSMNYKIMHVGQTVYFKQDEPFCTIFPIQRKYEENFKLTMEPLGNNQTEYDNFMKQRESFISSNGHRENQYRRGLYHNGEACPVDHQVRLTHK